MPEPTALSEQIVKRFDKLKQDRTVFDEHWEDVAQYVIPRKRDTFHNSATTRTKGEKKTQKQYDSTAALALSRFASVVDSLTTPRNQIWHRIVPLDKTLKRDRKVMLWLEDLRDALFKYRYSPKANFSGQNYETNEELGAFGGGILYTSQPKDRKGVSYRAMPQSDCYFVENSDGFVDQLFRKLVLTAEQAVEEFGRDKLPEKIARAIENRKLDEEFEFIHCVKKKSSFDPEKIDHRGMPYGSYYVFKDDKSLVKESGYRTFPFAISRYVTGPREVYGRSPAMMALPTIKTLNEQKKTMLKQGQRVVDPVLLAHSDHIAMSLRPGKVNHGAINKDGRRLVDVLPTGNIAAGEKMMEQERAVVNDVFLVTLFQILTETPRMTATEVLERAQEKGLLLAPTMGRQQSEKLGPLIEREVDLLTHQGLIAPPPQKLLDAGAEYEVEYDSPLSRAARSEQAGGLYRYMEFATAHANATGSPMAFDHIDVDKAAPEIMDIHAVPESWRASEDMIQATREGRQQAAEQQQLIEAAPAAASLAKTANG